MSGHSKRSCYSRRRNSPQQDSLDQQIRCLHQAMAKKLLANNEYFEPVCRTIEARYASGKMGYGCYLFWSSLMEHSADAELFLSTLLDNSPSIRKYRRKTPFIGILTEQERQQALDELTFY